MAFDENREVSDAHASARTLGIWIGSLSLVYLAVDAHLRAREAPAVSLVALPRATGEAPAQSSPSIDSRAPAAAEVDERPPRVGFFAHLIRAFFFAKDSEKFGVMGFGTGLLLWTALIVTALAIGYRESVPTPYLLETISGLLGLAGAVKIGAGVVLGADEIRELWLPLTASQSSESNNRLAIVGILNAMKSASEACGKGTVFLIVAFVIQLLKPGAETAEHRKIELPPAPPSTFQAKAPPAKPRAADPILGIPSRAAATASRPAPAASNQPAKPSAPRSAASQT